MVFTGLSFHVPEGCILIQSISVTDFNHCDLTTMLGDVADNENEGQVKGIAYGSTIRLFFLSSFIFELPWFATCLEIASEMASELQGVSQACNVPYLGPQK
jgi:hypothetical protein